VAEIESVNPTMLSRITAQLCEAEQRALWAALPVLEALAEDLPRPGR